MKQKWNGSAPTSATSYSGFYYRNNLACTSAIPSQGPFNLCPDIIQSNMEIDNPQQTLGSAASWANAYNTDPGPGSNFYYLRGTNANNAPVTADLSLYYCPAQLVLLPETWQNNPLYTDMDVTTVPISSGAGQHAVAAEPFIWPNPAPNAGSDFYSFIAQASDSSNPDPIPTVTSWVDMSDLLLNNLGFGFRNTCYVEADMINWSRTFQLAVPASIEDPGTLQIMITANGFTGNYLAIDSTDSALNINKFQVTKDGFSESIQLNPQSGLNAGLSLQYWNEAGSFPASGSTIAITAYYLVQQCDVYEAGIRGTINHNVSKIVSAVAGMPHNTWVQIGGVTFVVE